jgi:Protein of unknown function (DUF1549)/Protein of unknown function (DUF1553)
LYVNESLTVRHDFALDFGSTSGDDFIISPSTSVSAGHPDSAESRLPPAESSGSRRPAMRQPLRPFAILGSIALLAAPLYAQPVHQRIDELIGRGYSNYEKQAAPLAVDAEFLRRVTLDLSGTIPTADETRAFLADKSGDKRIKAIDKLLASPAYARRITWHFDTMLLERRNGNKVARPLWEEFLRSGFETNKPLDQLVRDILSADGVDAKARGPAKFYLDRDLEPNLVTRDIGRVFLGRNLQCAQCHDSPIVDDYKQEHYYGIQAFLNRSFLFPNAQAPTAVIAEKAEGETSFTSVFDKAKAVKSTGPKMPGGKTIAEPKIEKGKEYKVAPAKDVRPIPNFSRREQLANSIVESPYFARNAANRLWALMMGRGIVHPLDLDHKDNPPSHPELLDLLAKEFVAHKHDIKWLVREIALSKTYQRSSAIPEQLTDVPADKYLVAVLKPLSPEQFAYALMQASGHTDAERLPLATQTRPGLRTPIDQLAGFGISEYVARKLADAALNAKLAPQLPTFVRMFGSQPGVPEDNFLATLDQTLFFKHNAAIRTYINVRPGGLIDRANKLTDSNAIADELFLSVFSRSATTEEKGDIADVLKDAKDKNAALSEIIWAMVASAEFRFNH